MRQPPSARVVLPRDHVPTRSTPSKTTWPRPSVSTRSFRSPTPRRSTTKSAPSTTPALWPPVAMSPRVSASALSASAKRSTQASHAAATVPSAPGAHVPSHLLARHKLHRLAQPQRLRPRRLHSPSSPRPSVSRPAICSDADVARSIIALAGAGRLPRALVWIFLTRRPERHAESAAVLPFQVVSYFSSTRAVVSQNRADAPLAVWCEVDVDVVNACPSITVDLVRLLTSSRGSRYFTSPIGPHGATRRSHHCVPTATTTSPPAVPSKATPLVLSIVEPPLLRRLRRSDRLQRSEP